MFVVFFYFQIRSGKELKWERFESGEEILRGKEKEERVGRLESEGLEKIYGYGKGGEERCQVVVESVLFLFYVIGLFFREQLIFLQFGSCEFFFQKFKLFKYSMQFLEVDGWKEIIEMEILVVFIVVLMKRGYSLVIYKIYVESRGLEV